VNSDSKGPQGRIVTVVFQFGLGDDWLKVARSVFAAVRGPVGPGGGTAKSPGRDGTAKCSPSSSLNFQDGRH